MVGTLLVVSDQVSAWTLEEIIGVVSWCPLSVVEATDDCHCLLLKQLLGN